MLAQTGSEPDPPGGFMESLGVPAAIIVVAVCIAAVVATKVLITSVVAKMRRDIGRVAQVKKESLGRLKLAQSQTHVAAKNVTRHQRTKRELTRKIASLRKELRDISDEDKARRQRADSRRVP